VGNLSEDPDPTKKTDCQGIDFLYHDPYLDVYTCSSEYIVSRTEHPSTECLQSRLANLPAQVDFQTQHIDGTEVHVFVFMGKVKGNVRGFQLDD
jgi:hypothetical protein